MTTNSFQYNSEETCPFIGFIDDKGTAMAYPSDGNVCHKCSPLNIPSASHQREYCLAKNHSECSVFRTKQNQPMPKELLFNQPSSSSGWRNKIFWITGMVLAVVFILAIVWFSRSTRVYTPFTSTPTAENLPTKVTPTANVSTETPTIIPTTIEPTATRTVPTLTNTPYPVHMLETPIGIEKKLMVHKVKEGETFILLAATYDTTVDAIKAINVYAQTLWTNSLWVIPVGQKDVSTYPQLKAEIIDIEGTTLEEVAAQYSVDISLLSQINQLPYNYSFHKDEWVVIPMPQMEP